MRAVGSDCHVESGIEERPITMSSHVFSQPLIRPDARGLLLLLGVALQDGRTAGPCRGAGDVQGITENKTGDWRHRRRDRRAKVSN